MGDSFTKRCWRAFNLINRPLTSPRTDPVLNRVTLAVTYVAAGIGLWYFWIVRPLWVSAVLLMIYAGLSECMVGRCFHIEPVEG